MLVLELSNLIFIIIKIKNNVTRMYQFIYKNLNRFDYNQISKNI